MIDHEPHRHGPRFERRRRGGGILAALFGITGALIAIAPARAHAAELTIASWNLGWHVARDDLPRWIDSCNRRFVKNPATGRWDLAADGTPGWQVRESRAQLEGVDLSRQPPCRVYLDGGQAVPPTAASWDKRLQQLALVIERTIDADVIAFQEVSGTTSVREALGAQAERYEVCSFDGRFKVQRLVFAWRKSLGAQAECELIEAISLPQEAPDDRVRPALVLHLQLAGRRLTLVNLHLKSGCVSEFDRDRPGDLPNPDNKPCLMLQKQIAPLEAGLSALAARGGELIVLGDFNRNLWHEAAVRDAAAVRTDGSAATGELPRGARVRNLLREVFDGDPPGTAAFPVPITCPGSETRERLCEKSHRDALGRAELQALGSAQELGCRLAAGLDHFVVAESMRSRVREAVKLPLGRFGRTRAGRDGNEPLLAVSDHCPIRLRLAL